jgi:hypothetical protein
VDQIAATKSRKIVFDEPKEADDEAISEIRLRTDLKSKGVDYVWGFEPAELARLVEPWTCPASKDGGSSAKWAPKRLLRNRCYGCATLWLKLDGSHEDKALDVCRSIPSIELTLVILAYSVSLLRMLI